MGDDMRRVHRSFANLLEGDRYAYVLTGLILGFDPTCAHSHARQRNPASARNSRLILLLLFGRTKMFHVIYDPGEDGVCFDQHEPWATTRKGIVSYRTTFYARSSDQCW
jgi:hypothetical protein